MARSPSVRGRLGVAAAIGAGLLAAGTAISIAAVTWQATSNTLADDVTLAAFVAAESSEPDLSSLPKSGHSAFLITLDDRGEIVEETYSVTPQLLDDLLEDVWSLTTIEDEVVAVTYDSASGDRDGELAVAGLPCVDNTVCDTVIVGAYQESFTTYLKSNSAKLILPVLIVALLAGLGARWLVGRSLRPVEKMRKELASITETNLESRVEVPSTGDELTDLGETFNQTIGRLNSAVRANERFVADAAHELRSPIAGVRAAVELEEKKSPGGILGDALVELDRAARLIDDLLVLARREGGEVAAFTDVDLDDIVRSEVRSAATRFPRIELSSTITPVRVRGQADALRRVVSNLLENACEHGGSRVQVVVAEDDDGARVEVRDDGVGIPASEVNRIFERFARLDESRARATGGSGLGLAIASEIAADHDATIDVSHSEMGGADFVLHFRAQRPNIRPNV